MSVIKNHDYDCTKKCTLPLHANVITSTLTKRSIADEKVAAFIAKTCCNFGSTVDDLGRSAVHLSASVGRYALLEWLLNQRVSINGRDYESGSTPLHRAIYYGCIDCAVLLLRYGASLEILDEDTRAPLQNVCRLCDSPSFKEVSPLNELLVWGSNKNYNLGTGSGDDFQSPQSVDFFRKEHISIEQMAIGTYHSLFLDKNSRLYAVGHGGNGRLGTGNENSLSTPRKVKVPMKNPREAIISISVSCNHSLVLTNHSTVFACGLNNSQQLGVREAGEKLLVFKEVVSLRDFGVTNLKRIIARDHHSLVYSADCIYIWGTNNGQLNVENDTKTLPLPKLMRLPPRTTIDFVESNNSATVVVSKENLLILFYNSKMKLIKPPNYEEVKSVSLAGGDNTKFTKGNPTALKLLILTKTNVVFIWYEMKQQFYRCYFPQIRLPYIDKVFYNANQILILSEGDVYRGKCSQISIPVYEKSDERKSKGNSSNSWSSCDNNQTEISQEFGIRIDLQRLSNIDRVIDIACNYEFTGFGVLQESNMKYFKLPPWPQEAYGFKTLYNDANTGDAIHDLVFHVDGETYVAHKFIIFSRAPGLRDIINKYIDKDIHLDIEDLNGKVFELILKWIYTNYFPNQSDLQDIQDSFVSTKSFDDLEDACKLLLRFAELFQLSTLTTFLKTYLQKTPFYLPQSFVNSKFRFSRLRRKEFPDLYDVRILCAGDIELQAHKCVLVGNSEYFNMMFSHTWAEQTTINLSTVPVEYMEPIIEFLYSFDAEYIRKQNYSENFLYNMIVFCDQFFIEALRKVCELLLLDKINIRKCGDMLDFSYVYNCEILRSGCMQYICQNLTRVLNQHILDDCEPEALQCLNKHYRNIFKDVFDYRVITPDSAAVDDEELLTFIDDFNIEFDNVKDEDEMKNFYAVDGKSKAKEQKFVPAARQYERDAISSMLESINTAERSNKLKSSEKSKTISESKEIAEELQLEAKSWLKVANKKEEQRKRRLPLHNANESLEKKEGQKGDLISLNKSLEKTQMMMLQTPEKEKTPPRRETTSESIDEQQMEHSTNKLYNIDLSEFATISCREKLSQKQRKRISSGSSFTNADPITLSFGASSPITEKSKPLEIPNAWGTPRNNSSSNAMPYVESSPKPDTFASKMQSIDCGGISPIQQNNDFAKILLEESKQRDYAERMRSKSLVLTQTEETAIAELHDFYNVDNVDDEVITITRKTVPRTMNLTAWYRN